MPIDINRLRADRGGDLETVRRDQAKRFKPEGLVDKVLTLDVRWRELVTARDRLREELNALQKDVIAPKKKRREDCDEELKVAQSLRERLKAAEIEAVELETARLQQVALLGNSVDESVPVSKDEADGELVALSPSPAEQLTLPCSLRLAAYTLPKRQPLTHDELLWRVGGYDPERGAKVAGSRGYFLRGCAVLLNQALLNYALNFLAMKGYVLIQPPYFMKKDLMAAVAQLSDFDEQLYKVGSSAASSSCAQSQQEDDKYLIATSEQPLCGYHAKEVLTEEELPLRYAGVSTCFRKEVGKMNQEIRGIFRVHQFEKVEQFCITTGDLEESQRIHKEMLACAEEFHNSLGLAFRVVNVVSGELNDAARCKFDLEGWFPGQGSYRELVSCSNCTDFQSRALEIRARPSSSSSASRAEGTLGGAKAGTSAAPLRHVHMLNATLTATGRGICCILENYQTPEGVRVPEVLIPYMAGQEFLPFVR